MSPAKLLLNLFRSFIASLLVSLSFWTLQAADPMPTDTPKPIPPLQQAGRLPVVYERDGMDDVHIETDIDYLTPANDTHQLDIYTPNDEDTFPVVVLVHGGVRANARFKDIPQYTSWGRLVAASGFAAVTFNWDHPKSSDLAALFTYLRVNREDLHIDPSKMCVVAFSGGVDPTLTLIQAKELGKITCFVGYYGGYEDAEAGLEDVEANLFPPTLILHGAEDEFFPLRIPESYVKAASELDLPVNMMIHPQGVHAFDLRNNDDDSRTLIEASLDFMTEHLLPSE